VAAYITHLFYSISSVNGGTVILPWLNAEAMVQCAKKFLPLCLIYFPIFQRINKKIWVIVENVCKICCQLDYFETLLWGRLIYF
jgi:hypothetical protein